MCPVESADDRAIFTDPDDFGVTVSYTPAGGSPFDVDGVLDSRYFADDVGASVPVEGSRPRLTVQSALIPTAAHGDELVITRCDYQPDLVGKEYVVRSIEPDRTGMTDLVLEEQ